MQPLYILKQKTTCEHKDTRERKMDLPPDVACNLTEDPKRDACEVARDEYKLLWSYYIKLLDERARYAARYIQIVAIPAAIISFYFHRKADGAVDVVDAPDWILVLSVGILFVIGMALTGYYIMETLNGRAYLLAMSDLRRYFADSYPDLSGAITIDKNRKGSGGWDSIPFLRILPFFVGNAALVAVAVHMLKFPYDPFWTIYCGILSVPTQYFLFRGFALRNDYVHQLFPWPRPNSDALRIE
jgi:hypothetical protein